jgi:hypothetical protein
MKTPPSSIMNPTDQHAPVTPGDTMGESTASQARMGCQQFVFRVCFLDAKQGLFDGTLENERVMSDSTLVLENGRQPLV